MMRRLRALSLLAIAAPLGVAAAQQQKPAAAAQQPAAPSCPIDLMQPQQIGIANISRQKVLNAKSPDDAKKAMRDASKLLFDDKTKSNVMGRDYLLAQFLTLAIEHNGEIQTRDDLGFPGDKKAKVDLVPMVDSLFTLVEKGEPKCKDEIEQWRQYKPFITQVQAAYKAIGSANTADTAANRAKVDSAEFHAKRALTLSREGAQPYDILWRVAKARNDEAGEVANLQLAADKLAGDTLNGNVRANMLFNLGRIQQEFADKKQGAEKTAMLQGAAKAYATVVKEYPASDEAPYALQGIAVASALTSDSTLVLNMLTDVMANIGKFGDIALAKAGVMATSVGHSGDAAKLFDAASQQNPYSRDYLYNLAAMLYESKRADEMMPVVRKLVALDPDNPDNMMLFAYAFKGQSDKATDAAVKKAMIDSVAYYSKLSDDMPMRVSYTEFSRLKDATSLKGEVENRTDADKSYAINFEFMDKTGAVVAKQTANVGPVAAHKTASFTVDLTLGGISGVRYAPLPLK